MSDADEAHDAAGAPRGVDLARAALMQARAQAKARHERRESDRQARRGFRRSGSGPDDRDPQPLARVMGRLSEERGWRTPVAVHGVMRRWPEIVGAQVASYCLPEHFQDGRLTVRADSHASVTHIRWLCPELVKRINHELGHGTVVSIRVLPPAGARRGGRWSG